MIARVEVVRKSKLRPGRSTPGMKRDSAFESEGLLVARSRISGGRVSAWHHHGKREVYGFLVEGSLRIEFGEGGKRYVDLHPGDFFHIPKALIHRDVNPKRRKAAVVANFFVGSGDIVVNVDGREQ
ncbi:MAG: cupin domain-containing protein [Nitrososphaerales archaeon]|nr:cupin domain-containing protein [Nitrososphaerales archaeon]